MIGGLNPTGLLEWRSHDNGQVAHTPIIHVAVTVADAVADADETYGAYAAAENNAVNNNKSNNAISYELLLVCVVGVV